MPIFEYRARDYKGNLVQGKVDSSSATAVATYLLQEGLTPTRIREVLESRSFFERLERKLQVTNVKPKDLMAFCRQMHALIKASVPVVNALTYLLDSIKSVALNNCLKGVINAISSGQNLTQAFAKYPTIFTPIFVNIIDAGENSGQLEMAFLRIAEHLEFELTTSRQFKSVMRYPLMVITVALMALMIVNFMVVPAFAKLFAGFKTQLPIPTRILIATSNFLIGNWLYLLVLLVVIFFAVHHYLKTKNGRLLWDEYKLKIPIIGGILKQIILSRFARIFAMMIQSGVPIARGLVLVAKVVDNEYISNGILFIRNGVEHGESISKTAAQTHIFTPMILQMLNVGEETGSIDYLLLEIAKYYESEVQYSLNRLSETIEPVLLIFMGGIVLLLALGVFLPMWNMIQFI